MSLADQPTFDGLAKRSRVKRTLQRTLAQSVPIARVMLDVQAPHLGQTFDYLVTQEQDQAAQPGTMVRVRFGSRRVQGFIWQRVGHSATPYSSLRYLDRVIPGGVLVSQSMREDITAIAQAYGGTVANILRLAIPARVARVDREQYEAQAFNTLLSLRRRMQSSLRAALTKTHSLQHNVQNFSMHQDMQTDSQAFTDEIMMNDYEGITYLRDALLASPVDTEHLSSMSLTTRIDRSKSFVVNTLPGAGRWAQDVAWMIASAMSVGRQAVAVLPTLREVNDVMRALMQYGLEPYKLSEKTGVYSGDVARLSASDTPEQRYRAFKAVSQGVVSCVLGTRASMYAPVESDALFIIIEDCAYQYADGMRPYAQARGVMRLRAQRHGGIFVAVAFATSAVSQYESSCSEDYHVYGASRAIVPRKAARQGATAWVRWLNRETLAQLADQSIGARIPHTAVRVIRQALQDGFPVLFSIPQDGLTQAAACAQCHQQARCRRCTGPLDVNTDGLIARCSWCGAALVTWSCPQCGGRHLQVVRVGAAGTVQQLAGLFRSVPIIISSPHSSEGIVEWIDQAPVIVVATAGAEPRVRRRSNGTSHSATDSEQSLVIDYKRYAAGEQLRDATSVADDVSELTAKHSDQRSAFNGIYGTYRVVALLDTWTSLYATGLDARIDTLCAWMKAASNCDCRARNGSVLIIGETYPVLAQALMSWDASMLTRKELAEREAAGMPPYVTAACVWGSRTAVMRALADIGALGALDEFATKVESDDVLHASETGESLPNIRIHGASLPALLGVVPMHAPSSAPRVLEGIDDRVRAVVRVEHAWREELILRLRRAQARHSALRQPGELRFSVDPKDLLSY